MEHYTKEQIGILVKHALSLPEKQRRHFIATQYIQLGFGSQRYIAEVFNCSRITITKGVLELEAEGIDYSRQRELGGGRKKKAV